MYLLLVARPGWRGCGIGPRWLRLCSEADLKRIDPDRVGDILELGRAQIGDRKIEPRFNLAICILGKADRSGPSDALQPCSNVHAVTHQIAVGLLDDVAEVDADTEHDPTVLRDAGVALDHRVLHLYRASHRIDHASELDNAPVAGSFDDAAVVHGDGRVDEVAAQGAQSRERAILVRAGELGKADDVGSKDRREFAGFGHGLLRRNAY